MNAMSFVCGNETVGMSFNKTHLFEILLLLLIFWSASSTHDVVFFIVIIDHMECIILRVVGKMFPRWST
jgi:hypothetical protein